MLFCLSCFANFLLLVHLSTSTWQIGAEIRDQCIQVYGIYRTYQCFPRFNNRHRWSQLPITYRFTPRTPILDWKCPEFYEFEWKSRKVCHKMAAILCDVTWSRNVWDLKVWLVYLSSALQVFWPNCRRYDIDDTYLVSKKVSTIHIVSNSTNDMHPWLKLWLCNFPGVDIDRWKDNDNLSGTLLCETFL